MALGQDDPDSTVPMLIPETVTNFTTVPLRIEEETSDGRPIAVALEVTKRVNTIRMVIPSRTASASGEIHMKKVKEWSMDDCECVTVEVDGIVELSPIERLAVLQGMLKVAHEELDIDPEPGDGVMEGPAGAYDMENAVIKTDMPIGDAIALRRESEEIDGVKMILFRPGMLRAWLVQQEEYAFSSVYPYIHSLRRESAKWFLHHVTKTLKEYEPANPNQPTILEVTAS